MTATAARFELASPPPDSDIVVVGVTAGQNFQYDRMLEGLVESGQFEDYIDLVGDLCGIKDPRRIPEAKLSKGYVMQTATTACQVAAGEIAEQALAEAGLKIDFELGMSLGKVASAANVGSIAPEDAIKLAHTRATSAADAVRHAVMPKIGLGMTAVTAARLSDFEYEKVKDLLREKAEAIIQKVNDSLGGGPHISLPTDTNFRQIAISGTEKGRELFKKLWAEAEETWDDRDLVRARFKDLTVRGAFHTIHMRAGQRRYQKALNKLDFKDPTTRRFLLDNGFQELVAGEAIKKALLADLTGDVPLRIAVELFLRDVIGSTMCKNLLIVEQGMYADAAKGDTSTGPMIKLLQPTIQGSAPTNAEGAPVSVHYLRFSSPQDTHANHTRATLDLVNNSL